MQRIMQHLRALWAGWKKVAHVIGNFQARVLLTILYVVLVSPIALLVRAFADPLRLAQHSETYWVPIQRPPAHDVDEARRQS
jgi:hypothetical protein